MQMTQETVRELNAYLEKNNFYSAKESDDINRRIMRSWDEKLQNAITFDLKTAVPGIKIKKINSLFNIISDEQGATTYKLFLELQDGLETVEVIIKLILNYEKAQIYLGSRHATDDLYSGSSIPLRDVFTELKKADRKFGYFLPTDFYRFTI